MNETFNTNAKVKQMTKLLLSCKEEKGFIVKDPFDLVLQIHWGFSSHPVSSIRVCAVHKQNKYVKGPICIFKNGCNVELANCLGIKYFTGYTALETQVILSMFLLQREEYYWHILEQCCRDLDRHCIQCRGQGEPACRTENLSLIF